MRVVIPLSYATCMPPGAAGGARASRCLVRLLCGRNGGLGGDAQIDRIAIADHSGGSRPSMQPMPSIQLQCPSQGGWHIVSKSVYE